jgi:hypothetical protein
MEAAANAAFEAYREQYFEGGASSVYAWRTPAGFAAAVAIRKARQNAHAPARPRARAPARPASGCDADATRTDSGLGSSRPLHPLRNSSAGGPGAMRIDSERRLRF